MFTAFLMSAHQCDVFLDNERALLGNCKEEATMLLIKLGVHGDKNTGIRIRLLKSLMEIGDCLEMDASKLCSNKCDFYNRGFCKKRIRAFWFTLLGCVVTSYKGKRVMIPNARTDIHSNEEISNQKMDVHGEVDVSSCSHLLLLVHMKDKVDSKVVKDPDPGAV